MKTDNSFRAETRSPNGVAGVYSWLKPDGSPHTFSYSNFNGKYQTVPVFEKALNMISFLLKQDEKPSEAKELNTFGEFFNPKVILKSFFPEGILQLQTSDCKVFLKSIKLS